jgi:hypothetical protein
MAAASSKSDVASAADLAAISAVESTAVESPAAVNVAKIPTELLAAAMADGAPSERVQPAAASPEAAEA